MPASPHATCHTISIRLPLHIHVTDNIIFSNMSIKPSFLSFIFSFSLYFAMNGKWENSYYFVLKNFSTFYCDSRFGIYNIMCYTLRMLDMMRYVGVCWRMAKTVGAGEGVCVAMMVLVWLVMVVAIPHKYYKLLFLFCLQDILVSVFRLSPQNIP